MIESERKRAWDAALSKLDERGVIELAREALTIPSYSGEEEKVARFFAGAMNDIGMKAEVQVVAPSMHVGETYNAVGTLKGSGGGAALLFNGHIDHNPVCDGWTKDPFGGVIEDGWLYGFVHMKAADACYVKAVEAVKRAGIPLRGDVSIAHVGAELRGGAGTQHALRSGLKADYFILGEPTELQLAINHTASIVCRIHVLGRMKHFATVETAGAKGVNAVEKVVSVIQALGPSHRQMPSPAAGGWLTWSPVTDFEGLPQLNVGPIRGGIGADHNTSRPALFPDRCTLTVDFRIVPGMSKDTIRADLVRLLDGIAARDPDFRYEIEFGGDTFPLPFHAPRTSAVYDSVGAAHQHVHGKPAGESQVLKFAASDASWMAAAGITGVIYGPTGRYLSRPDERCETIDLVRAAQVYVCSIIDLCNREPPKG